MRDNLTNNHKSLVRLKLDYGICYENSNSNIIKILDLVHNPGIRCSTGAFRSSPIASILSITVRPPLKYCSMKLSLKYIARILATPDSYPLYK